MLARRYKNFKCTAHNKFFELNLYQKDPVNRHHWRANIARPSTEIDLGANKGGESPTLKNEGRETQVDKSPQDPAASIKPTSSNSEKSMEALTASLSGLGPSNVAGDAVGRDTDAFSKKSPRYVYETSFSRDYDDDFDNFGGGYSSDNSPKDYTACSSEDCGNCGHCDY
jgi:hypothetical protein